MEGKMFEVSFKVCEISGSNRLVELCSGREVEKGETRGTHWKFLDFVDVLEVGNAIGH